MFDEARARAVAEGAIDDGDVVLGEARELNDGWFFPRLTTGFQYYGGVIVNKKTGRPLRVIMHSSLCNDLSLYDRGYQFNDYDLVVLAVENMDEAVRVLHALGEVTTDKYYKNDRVYRVGRALTEAEVRERLSQLPCIFSGMFALRIDLLEQARQAGSFSFKAFEYRGKT